MLSKGLRGLLALMGVGIVVIGLDSLLRGADSVPGTVSAPARVDSEIRFYAAWYVVAGALLLLAAVRLEHLRTTVVVAVGTGFFLAACGRLLSWATVGDPETSQVILMVVEFVIPAVIVPLQLSVARQSSVGKKKENEPR